MKSPSRSRLLKLPISFIIAIFLVILVNSVALAHQGRNALTIRFQSSSRAGRVNSGHRRQRPPSSQAVAERKQLSPQELQQMIDETIHEEAARYHIDPLLIYAVIGQESSYGSTTGQILARSNPNALSPKGALGLMQLMPATARRFGVMNRRDVRQCIRGGVEYLVWLIDRFDGDVKLGLAGYNAGEGAVDKFGRRIPPYRETQNYVRLIEQRYLNLCRERRAKGGLQRNQREEARNAATPVRAETYAYRFRITPSQPAAPASTQPAAPPAARPGSR